RRSSIVLDRAPKSRSRPGLPDRGPPPSAYGRLLPRLRGGERGSVGELAFLHQEMVADLVEDRPADLLDQLLPGVADSLVGGLVDGHPCREAVGAERPGPV